MSSNPTTEPTGRNRTVKATSCGAIRYWSIGRGPQMLLPNPTCRRSRFTIVSARGVSSYVCFAASRSSGVTCETVNSTGASCSATISNPVPCAVETAAQRVSALPPFSCGKT